MTVRAAMAPGGEAHEGLLSALHGHLCAIVTTGDGRIRTYDTGGSRAPVVTGGRRQWAAGRSGPGSPHSSASADLITVPTPSKK